MRVRALILTSTAACEQGTRAVTALHKQHCLGACDTCEQPDARMQRLPAVCVRQC